MTITGKVLHRAVATDTNVFLFNLLMPRTRENVITCTQKPVAVAKLH